MGGDCSTNGRDENAYTILAGKPESKRPLGRSRRLPGFRSGVPGFLRSFKANSEGPFPS